MALADLNLAEFAENKRAVIHLGDETAVKLGPRTFRKRILRYGRWSHPNAPGGVLDVDRSYAKKLVANFGSGIWDMAAVTLGHPVTEKDGVSNSVGEVVGLEDEDDGLYAILTANADTAPKIGKEIKGCSAGLIPNYVDHEIGGRGSVGPVLGHLALTNEPYVKGLGEFEPVHLADDSEAVLLSKYEPISTSEDIVTKEELLAKAKELGVTPAELAAALGVEIVDPEKHKTLEQELADLKAGKTPPAPDPVAEAAKAEAAKAAASSELVAALGEALVGAKVITLSEGEKPSLSGVVKAIVDAVGNGNQARIDLAESQAQTAVAQAIREGKVFPAQKDAMVKLYLSDKETFEAIIPATAVVPLDERGVEGTLDLGEPPLGGKVDTSKEIDRYAELAKAL